MSETLTVELDDMGLVSLASSLFETIQGGSLSKLTLDMSQCRTFGALDLQSLIALEKSASALGVNINLQGVPEDGLPTLSQRSSAHA
jgi:anti-anti-sigma regulatory factor